MSLSRVLISISDPWDLGEVLEWRALPGTLLTTKADKHGGRALIELDDPISYQGSTYRYVVASPRHVGREISDLQRGGKVDSALTGISDKQGQSSDPLDTSNWRGGLAFIGEVERAAS